MNAIISINAAGNALWTITLFLLSDQWQPTVEHTLLYMCIASLWQEQQTLEPSYTFHNPEQAALFPCRLHKIYHSCIWGWL